MRRDLDYELELAFVLARPVRDASLEEAEGAIGGFFVINDFQRARRPVARAARDPRSARSVKN